MKRRGGFTILELILVIIITGIAVPPLIMVFAESMSRRANADNAGTAAQLAHSMMEEIRTRRWDETTPTAGGRTGTPTPKSNLGPDAGETSRAQYDDMDDFGAVKNESPPRDSLGNPMTGFNGFAQSVDVEYVILSGTSFVPTTTPAESDYKRITVSVSCDAGVVSLVAIAANKY